ncbi:hypothetical protein FAES_3933 [Fibrella aestuarina BUZ 2]|uniref:Uncharacterized protein n=1 Tax=Fibrella aestuarina BUZ 2 TaxID=1166018 RepID=I0KCT6_9BACT|nr:hypothetical protein [Fibrella aestuarina]CCH01939.1 hypothetical protein FAES_3933 [Fibrella aestuarina BUZ 2]
MSESIHCPKSNDTQTTIIKTELGNGKAVSRPQAESLDRIEKGELWRTHFIDLYQSGQHHEAAKLLEKEHPMLYVNLGLEGAYISIKKKMTAHTNGERVGFLFVAFIIAIMVVLVIKSSH